MFDNSDPDKPNRNPKAILFLATLIQQAKDKKLKEAEALSKDPLATLVKARQILTGAADKQKPTEPPTEPDTDPNRQE